MVWGGRLGGEIGGFLKEDGSLRLRYSSKKREGGRGKKHGSELGEKESIALVSAIKNVLSIRRGCYKRLAKQAKQGINIPYFCSLLSMHSFPI